MRSLTTKIMLAFLLVAIGGIALAALLASRTTANEFGDFMFSQMQDETLQQLKDYYETHAGWEGVSTLFPQAGSKGQGAMRGANKGGSILVVDQSHEVVVPGQGFRVGEEIPEELFELGVPIEVAGQEVGRVVSRRGDFGLSPEGEAFLSRVNQALLLGALGGIVLALLLGAFLARTLTRPLHHLTKATRAIAKGNLEQRVRVGSKDELGELANAFNQMSDDLTHAQKQRRQMTADIAHELRTPLSVILAHAEAIRDGVFPASDEAVGVIHDETLRLSSLVEDLRTLSLTEEGEVQIITRLVHPGALLEKAAAAQMLRAQQRTVTLHVDVRPEMPEIMVDPDRMAQVFSNLLDNALRYTPAGGKIHFSAEKPAQGIRLSVQDNGPGIPPEEIPRLFERFYRIDKSRQREEGGSGLGLAIAKSIVELHGGRISAESKPGKGTKFIIDLPLRSA